MKNFTLLILTMFCLNSLGSGTTDSLETLDSVKQMANSPSTQSPKTSLGILLSQLKELDKLYKGKKKNWDKHPKEWIEAKGLLHEAYEFKKTDPDEKDLQRWIHLCSLQVNLASIEYELFYTDKTRKIIQIQKDSILSELNVIYQKINQLERSYSSDLKQDLKRHRNEFIKRQEDAQKRFDALHSDVIKVKKDARGIILSMSDILFDVGQSSLKDHLKTNLAKIAGILTVYRQASIIVEGHTDNIGPQDLNQKLSENRAKAVLDFLVSQGIAEKRMTSVGYGFSKPVSENKTEDGRSKNRRVDLVITEKKNK